MKNSLMAVIGAMLLVNLALAIVISQDEWGPVSVYYEGTLTLTQEQYTQFKTDFAEADFHLVGGDYKTDKIEVLNNSEPIVVSIQLHNKPVDTPFPYGERTLNYGLPGGFAPWLVSSVVLLALYLLVCVVIIIAQKT